jgi:glycosyltransferase domain-containing protein
MNSNESNLDLLKKLTIIIPTYQRKNFVLRSMEYWSGKDVIVIVIDGSKKSLDADDLSQLNRNIKYIHAPISFFERIFSVINLINTEYVMLGCDDEFYIPSTLRSCLIKLSSDSKLVTCTGHAIGFKWSGTSVVGYDVYSKFKNINLSDPNPAIRLIKHFSNYTPAHTYAVCRASYWKIAAQSIFSKEFNAYAIFELQLEFLLVYAGKSLVIPELMWLRSDENEPIRGTSPSMIPSATFAEWWCNKKNKEEFIARMESACCEINKLTGKNHNSNITSTLDIFCKFNKKFFLLEFYKYLPSFIRNMIKSIFKIFGHDVTKKTLLIDKARSMQTNGVQVDIKELKKIEQTICSLHNNKIN